MWNVALTRLTRRSTGSSSAAGTRFQSGPMFPVSSAHTGLVYSRASYGEGGDVLPVVEFGRAASTSSSCPLPLPRAVAAPQGSTSSPVVEPYVPSYVSSAPIPSVIYYPTPATRPTAAAGGPHTFGVDSAPSAPVMNTPVVTTPVVTRTYQSSVDPPDPFALCLPVPFSRAVESLDTDILEAAAREAGIRRPSARPASSVPIPDVVIDSEYSDMEPVTPRHLLDLQLHQPPP